MSAGRFKSAAANRAFPTGFAQIPCALRAAAIYGANGSGKSSLVKAIDIFQDLVIHSFGDETGNLLKRVIPFKYNTSNCDEPSNFEMSFIANEVLYTYGFLVDSEKIHEEWLHVKTKEGRVREAFSRALVDGEYEWHFSSFFKSRRLTSTCRDATRPNALFISTAVHLNLEEIKAPHDWITNTLRVVATSNAIGNVVTSQSILDSTDTQDIVELLKIADSTVDHILVKPKSFEDLDVMSMFSEEFRVKIAENLKDAPNFDVRVTHVNSSGERMDLDLSEESDGTKVMYRYAAPFVQSLKHGFVLIIDELDRSLHPILLRYLIEKFVAAGAAALPAQLIFTTHDSALLSSDVLARDQIWFVENLYGRGTELIPLADYKPRKGEAIQRAYLHGRYGAIPLARQRVLDLGNAE